MSTQSNQALAELLSKPNKVTKAIQGAVRVAPIDHHKADRPVVVWCEGRVVEVYINENGEVVSEA